MPTPITVVAVDAQVRERLAALIPAGNYSPTTCDPDELPDSLPRLFVVSLPGVETREERLIVRLRAEAPTAAIPIVIASALPMVQLQSLPYASDWTIAIVEEPVDAQVLGETMSFLLGQ
jgi:hypothetical protein